MNNDNLPSNTRDPVKTSQERAAQTSVNELDNVSSTESNNDSFIEDLSFSNVSAQAKMSYWKKRKEFIDKYKKKSKSDIKMVDAYAAKAIANVMEKLDNAQANVKTSVHEQIDFGPEAVEKVTLSADRHNDLLFELRLVEHGCVDAAILTDLAKSRHIEVKEAVADHPDCPLSVLISMALSDSLDLRYAIAENHNLPLSVIEILTDDDSPFVAMRAQKTLKRLLQAS